MTTDPVPPDLLDRILQAAAAYPERPALSGHRGRTLRYRDLAVAVLATAKGLRRNGFRSGDRMLFCVRPDPGGIVLMLGTVAAGGTVVFLDPHWGTELFAARSAAADAQWAANESALYADRTIRPGNRLTLPDYRQLNIRTLRAGPWLPGVPKDTLSVGALGKSRTAGDDEPLPGLRGDPSADAVVVYTSGTTAPAKAVVHTRGSLGAALTVLAARYQINEHAQVFTHQLMVGLPALAVGAEWQLPAFGPSARMDPVRFAPRHGPRHPHLPAAVGPGGPADRCVGATRLATSGVATDPGRRRTGVAPSRPPDPRRPTGGETTCGVRHDGDPAGGHRRRVTEARTHRRGRPGRRTVARRHGPDQ